jgi:Zn-finger nucleic acid-binding protein
MEHAFAPYRSLMLHCPRCPSSELSTGKLHRCGTCDGTWIDERELAERVSAMQERPGKSLAWSGHSPRERLPCATCRQPMEPLLLYAVAVDRCTQHGVWFDRHELGLVLERSARLRARPVVHAHGHGSTTALDVAAVGVEIAFDAAESGVIDAVLEVLGGLFSAIDL